jgi:hypothetical protein
MPFKFEGLEVWQLALDYIDVIYEIASQLPRSEEYNLKSQIARAATSVALNIAEGSTSQTDAEKRASWAWLFAPCWRQSPASISSTAANLSRT